MKLNPAQRAEAIISLELQAEWDRRNKPVMIKPKGGSGCIPLVLNRAQKHVRDCLEKQRERLGYVRATIIKGRQQGISTYISSRFYQKTTRQQNKSAFIFAHTSMSASNLYNMTKTFYERSPENERPELDKSNDKELRFKPNGSGYKVATAGAAEVGRGETIEYLHWSEVAFSAKTEMHSKGLMEAVPELPGTEIILESTANGSGNFFHRMVKMGLTGQQIVEGESGGQYQIASDWITIFCPWYWQEEYTRPVPAGFEPTEEESELLDLYGDDGLTIEHLVWRRHKIAGKHGDTFAFKQEYPFNVQEAFFKETEFQLIRTEYVIKARYAEPYHCGREPLIIGLDPARLGKDSIAYCMRRGRNVLQYGVLPKDTIDMTTDRVAAMIRTHRPDCLNIDCGGLGVGIFDYLVKPTGYDFGHIVRKVDFNGKTINPDYFNKRSEMYGEAETALRDGMYINANFDEQLYDRLQEELCSIQKIAGMNSKLKSKDDMKKEGLPSPDLADAFALMFATEVIIDDDKWNNIDNNNDEDSFWHT